MLAKLSRQVATPQDGVGLRVTCGILQQVIFGWLCQSTIIASNNWVAMPIHRKSNEHLGGNADPRNYS